MKKKQAKKKQANRKKDTRVVKTTILKRRSFIPEIPKETPLVRYTFSIISLVTNKQNIIEEIVFNYKGTLVIPKSLKETWQPNNHTLQGTFVIPKGIKSSVLNKDYRKLTRKEVVNFLSTHIRDSYIDGLKEIIYKEVWPDYKIINKLPWK
jgi:hypothetical protein